ncbi:hypothetical protein [Capnocytophaga catalasegens]|uniref:Lipoprotein n=1 Tax=Capnocytophaga catalasegens TaxID=1004260 RepID=A0AAV5B0G1_9FLAO|nr:hypothetical protein [Capnocytophaga catalasegens]GIZ16629.1 hypothetical protein RCZ03_26290 [Capnocytophaga catalasegens]GJM51557.1 hypothetical protein RCZ15_25300 [Capnocytophaga catalasegens]GJM54320.1 hypothetical protein RCZ16_26360 [Capnocytophaga catalasegens]
MKKFFILISIIFLNGCYNVNKHIKIEQENCPQSPIYITFFTKKNAGVVYLKNKIKIKNPSLQFVYIDFSYLKKGEIETNTAATLLNFDKKFFNETGKNNRIQLNPLSEKEVEYYLWIDIDTLDFVNKHKNLNHYFSLAQPSINIVGGKSLENKNTLEYHEKEPFSEFKRKNPELLEFLTKGDSIELEVISPVKQKYKFKAEW